MKNKKRMPKYLATLQSLFGKRLEKTVTIVGQKPGAHVVISAGVHGNEHCGLKAFAKIMPKLRIGRGRITFIIGNPKACFEKKRETVDGTNLNRLGLPERLLSEKQRSSYEYLRAQIYKRILPNADALLDIHSGTALTQAVIICEPNAHFATRFFAKGYTHEIYGFDAIEPGAWDGYMLSLGKPGITIECGFHEDPKGPEYAENAIMSFLSTMGILEGRVQYEVPRKHVQMFLLYLTKYPTFTLARDFTSLEPLKKGARIGYDGKKEVRAPRECLIIFPHNCTKKNAEAFLLGYEID